jgi:hypothetical protein
VRTEDILCKARAATGLSNAGDPAALDALERLLIHLTHLSDRFADQRSPQGKHGKHEYSLEEFGLTATAVRQHFHNYCARFEIPLGRRT